MKTSWRTLSVLSFPILLCVAWMSAPPSLTRGPYQQSVSASGITLVCRTSATAEVTLRFGEHAGPPWEGERTSPAGTTHEFRLTDLRPETRYLYELSTGGAVLATGDDHVFRTAPPAESRAPFRFLAWGDSGTGGSAQMRVAAQMERVIPEPVFALGLGDLVYDSGAAADFDPKLFEPYATLFARSAFWPTLGNHDADTQNGAPFYDAFYLPTTTGAPGHPSNTERYYSFDHGMAHFACLDSETTSSTPGGAMYSWLEDDLDDARARGKRWLLVFMHHPPYSRGTHDSTSESDLITLHDDLVPLFDAKGVDMVMTGHSHVYERSFLAKNDAVLQSDLEDYTKIGSPDGTVYLVTGCAGKSGSGPLDLPLMARSYGNVTGFSVIDVGWRELRGRFVEDDGRTTDLFTLHKATDVVAPRVTAVEAPSATAVRVVFDEPVQGGTGGDGAENLASWTLAPTGSVLAAKLEDDRSTVTLTTSALTPDRAYELSVVDVSDPLGHATDDRVVFARESAGGSLPNAVLAADVLTANVPAHVRFSGEGSSDPDGPLAAYVWAFGDGTSVNGRDAEHTYTQVGTYAATLVVRDGDGNEAFARTEIRVHDQGNAPHANLTATSLTPSSGARVVFGSAGSADPDGGAVTYHWDFGDPASGTANFSNDDAPSHVYASAGTYTATLVVTDDEGSSASDVADLDVGAGGGGGGGGSSGGGCSIDVRGGDWPRGGDPVLAVVLALALLELARRTLARQRRLASA